MVFSLSRALAVFCDAYLLKPAKDVHVPNMEREQETVGRDGE
jgi:hypothetical protein